ncbi:MAG: glycosyltransferase [Planctomycetes bacterium]|nr:glycosyltransferase [Planctomycetota bacterium]
MKTKKPLVSVVIPTFNSGKFVVQAVKSVLEQSYRSLEVLVVDDGSTDNTKVLLSDFNDSIKYHYRENKGPSAARNFGIKMAKGEYVSFLDADDLWIPGKIEVQLDFFERYRDLGLLFSDVEEFDEDKILPKRFSYAVQSYGKDGASQVYFQEAYVKLLMNNFICTSTVMVRSESFKKAGFFDESLRIVEDRDMWLRIAAHFKIARLPLVLTKKRKHDSNISANPEIHISSQIKVLEKHLRLFPELVPSVLINKKLSQLYLSYGYIHLLKNRKRESRKMAIHSLSLATTIKAFELILLTFMGQSVIQFFRRNKS